MSNIKNEVIQKLRSDIRSKLDQIGAFVDNELSDYIMVLVANQKTKYQMKDDLSLFLGAETDQFVNWLHSSLKQLQLNATQGDDKKVVTNEEAKEVPKTDNLSSNLNKTKANHNKKVIAKKFNKSDKNEDKSDVANEPKVEIMAKNEIKVKVSDELAKPKARAVNAVSPQLKPQINDNIESNEQNNEKQEQNDGEVVLHLNPDGGEVDELLQESDVNDNNNKTDPKVVTKQETVNAIKSAKVLPLKRKLLTPTVSSSIGSVVCHKHKQTEEERGVKESPERPAVASVASVVRVNQRKPTVPLERQANKNLLLKAVKDAHESTSGRKRAITAVTDVEYTPTPIKRRLGERPETVFTAEEVVKQDLDPEDLRNYLNVTKNDTNSDEPMPELVNKSRIVKKVEVNPQFVVTLDGVDHNKYSQSSDIDDQIILNEEVEEEFNEDEDMADNDLENDDLSADRLNERCRYWPSCKNGDNCEFQHPTTPCKTFPNCRFGDKCLYIHPNCKFDAMCSRRDCPFTHASKRLIGSTPLSYVGNPLAHTSLKPCKYLSNCKNTNCPFFHPKNCRFGAKCRSRDCVYTHPNVNYTAAAAPNPHQFKWKASDHSSHDSKTTTSS